MDTIKQFASEKIKPYGTNMSDPVERTWTMRDVVSAFVVIALAPFCSPSLQVLHRSITALPHHQEQFNHKAKISLCVFAKASTKVCIRKSSGQQPGQFFYSAGDISLRPLTFFARSLCATRNDSDVARGSLTLRERAPPA
jgi:hypothetical protein